LTVIAGKNNILNVKWTFADTAKEEMPQYEVPEDIVANVEEGDLPLNQFIRVTE